MSQNASPEPAPEQGTSSDPTPTGVLDPMPTGAVAAPAGRRLVDRIPVVSHLRHSVGWQRGMLVTGLVLTGLFVVIAVLAPWIAPYGYAQRTTAAGQDFGTLEPPSAQNLLGTTVSGFDVLSRTIWGAQTALLVIICAIVFSIFIGVFIGLLSGYFGGWVDRVLVVVADAIYAFPSLLLAIVMAIVISHGQSRLWGGVLAAAISITVVFVPQYFRIVRSEVLRVKAEPFVESAKVIGVPTLRILLRHVLRNSMRSVPIVVTLNASEAVLTLAGLGFLGFGIEATAASEWGYDLSRSVSDVTSHIWWTALPPGIAIVLVVLGITLVGESLNDLSDPRLRRRRRVATATESAAVGASGPELLGSEVIESVGTHVPIRDSAAKGAER